jgi:hypothetical protein
MQTVGYLNVLLGRSAMTDPKAEHQNSLDDKPIELEIGGLNFEASFRAPAGATLRVFGPTTGGQEELLRLDDFVDAPHYHLADGPPIAFDRAALGDPLDWFVSQLTYHLGEVVTSAGYAHVLDDVDLTAVANNADRIRKMVMDCVPAGYVRTPNVGLQKA